MRTCAIAIFISLAAGLFSGGKTHAETAIEILATDPPGKTVTLGRNQNFYLRIAYDTDEPVNIWVRPTFRGQQVKAGTNTSVTYTGRGEALGWFFMMQPGDEVDQIDVRVGDGTVHGTRLAISYPVRIVAGSQPATGHREPSWVVDLKQQAEDARKAELERRQNEPQKPGDTLLFSGFMLLVFTVGIIGFGAPVRAMRRWQGGWRVAAAVPLVMLAFVVLRIVFGVARDPTSHNLWPFEILQVAALSVVIMLALLVARKLIGVDR